MSDVRSVSPSTVSIPQDPVPDRVAPQRTNGSSGTWPAAPGNVKGSPLVAAPTAADVSPYRANDVDASRSGASLERSYRVALQSLPPGASLKVTGETRLSTLGAEASLKVTPLADGRYEAKLEGIARLGLGDHKLGPDASVKAGVRAGGAVTMRFDSLDEAADRLAALTQTAGFDGYYASVGNPLLGAVASRAFGDSDYPARTAAALRKTAVLEFHAAPDAKLKARVLELEANFKAAGPLKLTVDLERGKLVTEQGFEGSGKLAVDATRRFGPVEVKGAIGLGGEVSTSATLRSEVALSPEQLARVRAGEASFLEQIFNTEDGKQTLSLKTDYAMPGRKLSHQISYEVGQPLSSIANGAEWFLGQGSAEVEAGIDADAFNAKLKAKVELPGRSIWKGGDPTPSQVLAAAGGESSSDEDAKRLLSRAWGNP